MHPSVIILSTGSLDYFDKEYRKVMGSFKKKKKKVKSEAELAAKNEKAKKGERENAAPVYENRELSWLKFNERVLEEAEDERVPLCERLSFASIYQSNLDEFFMVRVGSLVDQDDVSPKMKENKTYMTAKEQIDAILKRVRALGERKDTVYLRLLEELGGYGIHIVDFRRIGKQESDRLERYFDSQIAPLITPILVERRQPFPFLQGKEIYAAVGLEKKGGKGRRLGIVPCQAGVFPRLIEVSSQEKTYMLAEELILHFVYKVFPGYYVKSKTLIRVTRNADIDADALYEEEEEVDYREFMAEVIKRRKHLQPVRLEYSREFDAESLKTLCEYMQVKKHFVFKNNTPLDLSFFFQIQDQLRQHAELFYGKRVPQRSPEIVSGRPILEQIREGDKLLCYPFESMRGFLDMLQEAANDPKVASIKMTLYRVARQSKVVEALIDAAENGKEVLVLVELKARFDEENNIEWSRRLEDAGCTVIYGLDGFKVHSKLCLITRREGDQNVYYTQIGTGNYNEKTARIYTDMSLMTARQEIGEEAAQVFGALAMGEAVDSVDTLMVAPKCLQNKILEKIDEQIRISLMGGEGWVGIKINSLTDKTIIEKLIEASRAGVKVDLVVRGICCLRPGVAGWTENIRIISIVGRFLEHSRIYIFGKGKDSEMYIASADFMTRNTLRRVEVAAPILDERLKERVQGMFDLMLQDNVQARELQPDGKYVRRRPGDDEAISSQEIFYARAYEAGSRAKKGEKEE